MNEQEHNPANPWPPGENDYHDNLMRAFAFDNLITQQECDEILAAPRDPELSRQFQEYSEQLLPGYSHYMHCRSELLALSGENAWLHERLRAMIEILNQKYYAFETERLMGTQILTLEAAQSLDFHFDLGAGLFSKRKISIMIFLSSPDDYQGGELDLMGSQYPPFRRERGDVLIFPSFYVNSFHPVSSGRLQILLTWMHGSQQFN